MTSAALDAQYGRCDFQGRSPPRLATFTIAPPPRRRMCGAAAWEAITAAFTFTSKASSRASSVSSPTGDPAEDAHVVHEEVEAAQRLGRLVHEARHLPGHSRVRGAYVDAASEAPERLRLSSAPRRLSR